ncbi:stevor PIR protein, putative [Plasmodium reichenowi]|uniref:Stevor PIR protein, putative n=1 Tax=Plasmodium reichenowi TaxID=5854 RepID=A0A2P9DSM9_PLARE|nr:stevor PIR protein, putative [Plasmodium reichenowi]
MNTYFIKMLLFTFLINTLVLPHNENYINNHYNINLILNNTRRTTIKSRLLAQTQNHNPHYHNDPELKEIIDKLNDEAIKKYQQTHDPYEQLKELVEKNERKITGRNGAEPMSTTEKNLLETYEEIFGEENHIMLKSGMYPNDGGKSDKSSSCECTDTNNAKPATTKGKDKYLKHLKHRCTRGICVSSVGSFLLTFIGLGFARDAALGAIAKYETLSSTCTSYITILNILDKSAMISSLEATSTCASAASADVLTPAASAAIGVLYPWGIAALVLLILAVVLIILYIWLYRRRKNSWKHECKKHLCK